MRLFRRGPKRHERSWDKAPQWALDLAAMSLFAIHKLETIMSDNAKILADLAAQTTVLQSLVVYVQATNATNADQAKQIADLKAALAAASVTDPAVQAAIDAMDKTIQSNTALAQGVLPAATANTATPPAEATAAADAAAQPAA